jgi:hypothetical protein
VPYIELALARNNINKGTEMTNVPINAILTVKDFSAGKNIA